jgi:hypothetical protein
MILKNIKEGYSLRRNYYGGRRGFPPGTMPPPGGMPPPPGGRPPGRGPFPGGRGGGCLLPIITVFAAICLIILLL